MAGKYWLICLIRLRHNWVPTWWIDLSPVTLLLPRYCLRWWNPGCEAIDAFSISWHDENNWLCAPPSLVGRCIKHLLHFRADGSLIVPLWRGSVWWPLICNDRKCNPFIVGFMVFPPQDKLFMSGTYPFNLLSKETPPCNVVTIRLCGCGKHIPSVPLDEP